MPELVFMISGCLWASLLGPGGTPNTEIRIPLSGSVLIGVAVGGPGIDFGRILVSFWGVFGPPLGALGHFSL